MRIEHIAGNAVGYLLGPLIRRAVMMLIIGSCSIVAVYHFSVAGMFALDAEYGPLQARLIIAAIYAAVALITLAAFLVARHKVRAVATTPILDAPREMRIAMLVEAVMLGYALARKSDRAN
jgi:hypothetical protein